MKLKHDSPGPRHHGERSGGRGRLFMTLVALASGGACTSNGNTSQESVIPTKAVASRGDALAESCTVRPPFTGNFEPELKWSWTGSTTLPDYKQVKIGRAHV